MGDVWEVGLLWLAVAVGTAYYKIYIVGSYVRPGLS